MIKEINVGRLFAHSRPRREGVLSRSGGGEDLASSPGIESEICHVIIFSSGVEGAVVPRVFVGCRLESRR